MRKKKKKKRVSEVRWVLKVDIQTGQAFEKSRTVEPSCGNSGCRSANNPKQKHKVWVIRTAGVTSSGNAVGPNCMRCSRYGVSCKGPISDLNVQGHRIWRCPV